MPDVFTHAVASFEPTADSVIIWSRLTGASETTWTIARDPAMEDVVANGSARTSADHDHTVRVEVGGLQPATTYWYQFDADGQRSPVGRTRTLPADASGVRIALVSCGRYSYAPLTVYRALAEVDVDLVVHMGDYIYEDDGSDGPRSHRPPHPAVSLDDYRQRIAQVREDPDAQALHLRHPMVAVWDDHDLADNAWSDGAKAHDPETQGPWRCRVEAAARARAEWLPGRYADPLVTWRALPLGGVGELLLLDTRIAGRDQHAGDDGTRDLHDPGRSMLGHDQRAWLDSRLADASRPWALVASSVVVNPIVLRIPAAGRVNGALPNGYAALDGVVMHDDQWDGYPVERDHLITRLEERGAIGARTLLMSGDVHASWAFDGPVNESRAAVALEVTTPSVSSAPFVRGNWPGMRRLIHRAVRELEHVAWSDLTERGFTVIDVTPDRVAAEWWFAHADDPSDPPATRRAATYACGREVWPPRWEEARPLRLSRTPGSAEPRLPARPDDIAMIHRSRRLTRVAGAVAAVFAFGGATVAGLWSPSGGRARGSRGRLTARS